MVRMTVDLTLQDFLKLNRLVLWRRMRWIYALFILGPVAIFATLASVGGFEPKDLGLVVGPLILVVVLPLSVRRSCRKRWREQPELQEPKSYEFSDAGIRWAGQSTRGELAWSVVKEVRTEGGMVLIRTGPNSFHILKQESLDRDQLAELDELFRRHVPGFHRDLNAP